MNVLDADTDNRRTDEQMDVVSTERILSLSVYSRRTENIH